MKQLLTIFFSLFLWHHSFATGQIPDYLIYHGDTLAIFSNPLEDYFEKTGNRNLPGFVGCGSTACWRGYVATWELQNDSLFLKNISSCHRDCGLDISKADLKQMFGSDKVFAYWFDGQIVIPQGKRVQYIHMGYASIYERELHLTFKSGILKRKRMVSNSDQVRKIEKENLSRKVAGTIQDTLFYLVKKNVDWDTSKTRWYDLCDEKYILLYNGYGRLKRVHVDWEEEEEGFRDKLDAWWWSITDERKCRRIIKNALKPLNISYLKLPGGRFEVSFEIFYDPKTNTLELWKPFGDE
jgi:hypothetical protein